MPVVTICNHKGGTGKTTTSVHLAAGFGHSGRRVLVVDFDPQGFLTRTLGLREPAPDRSALALLDPEADLRTFPVESVSGFDVIGSSMALTRSLRRLTKPTDVFWLRETLTAGHDYDLVLLDTAAALSVYTMNALVACDHVVIPVTPEYQPVVGGEQTWQTARLVKSKLNPALQPPRFLLTQVDARLNRHAKYSDYLREKYGAAVLSTPIRTSSSLATATRDGRTVFDARVTTRGAVDYATAAEEIGSVVFDTPSPRPLLRQAADGTVTVIDLHDDTAPTFQDAVPEVTPPTEATAPPSPVEATPAARPVAPVSRPAEVRRVPAEAEAAAEMLAQAREIADARPVTPEPGAPAAVPGLALAAAPLGAPNPGAEPEPSGWTSLDRLG